MSTQCVIKTHCSDINPLRDLRYVFYTRYALRRDMPCGARGDLYHIAFAFKQIYRFCRKTKISLCAKHKISPTTSFQAPTHKAILKSENVIIKMKKEL